MIQWIKKAIKREKFDNTMRPNVVVCKIGKRLIDSDTLAELEYRQLMGVYHREQMEAHAASCCLALGVSPTEDSDERDLCNEIVFHNENPRTVVTALARMYRADWEASS